jgi:hypothetical protein
MQARREECKQASWIRARVSTALVEQYADAGSAAFTTHESALNLKGQIPPWRGPEPDADHETAPQVFVVCDVEAEAMDWFGS